MIGKPASTDSYSSAAKKNFAALKDQYASNDTGQQVSFWKLGNSFDTMIDFLDIIDASCANDVAQIAVTQLNASLKHIEGGYDGAWFDDFGWWSVATQRALQKPFFNSDAKRQLQNILDQCWPRFTKNAPFVWERRKPGTVSPTTCKPFDDFGPAVDGGVWNAYWCDTPATYPGPKNGDPTDGHLIGIQNTVTNALYLMAAHRLGRTDPAARQAAQREWQFLLTWFDEKEDPLWWEIDDNAGLVRARVGHFANGVRVPHIDNEYECTGFQETWAWTGDQGLMLGNLGDAMLAAGPDDREGLLARAQHLVSGVRRRLVEGGGVVQSYTTTGCLPDFDKFDYQVGSGVFWRNYLYVWNTNPDLRTFLMRSENEAMVRASADAAAKPLSGNESIETLTNQTAVLVAATAKVP
jgi:hypothetical protein